MSRKKPEIKYDPDDPWDFPPPKRDPWWSLNALHEGPHEDPWFGRAFLIFMAAVVAYGFFMWLMK